MIQKSYDMNPVQAITAGAVGEPGHRVFYIQARTREAIITLVAEKVQVQLLAQGVYQLLAEIDDKYATTFQPAPVDPLDLELLLPLEPEFRVERMELIYDPEVDMVALVAHELVEEAEEENVEPQIPHREPSVAHLHATRSQVRALADHALEVAARGRPLCTLCGQPYDEKGHICPRRNGHASGTATL